MDDAYRLDDLDAAAAREHRELAAARAVVEAARRVVTLLDYHAPKVDNADLRASLRGMRDGLDNKVSAYDAAAGKEQG